MFSKAVIGCARATIVAAAYMPANCQEFPNGWEAGTAYIPSAGTGFRADGARIHPTRPMTSMERQIFRFGPGSFHFAPSWQRSSVERRGDQQPVVWQNAGASAG